MLLSWQTNFYQNSNGPINNYSAYALLSQKIVTSRNISNFTLPRPSLFSGMPPTCPVCTKSVYDSYTASLSGTPRSNSRGCKPGVKGKFGGVGRVLEKFPEYLNNTYDLCICDFVCT